MVCEKCWKDAGSTYYKYTELLAQRKDHPCTPQEQSGDYWDLDKKKDRRVKNG